MNLEIISWTSNIFPIFKSVFSFQHGNGFNFQIRKMSAQEFLLNSKEK